MPYMDGMGIKNGISVSGCKELNKPSLVLQCLTCVPVIVAGASTKDVEEAMWVGATESNRKMRLALKSLKTPKKRGRPYGMMQLLPNIQDGPGIILLALQTCVDSPRKAKVGLTVLQW